LVKYFTFNYKIQKRTYLFQKLFFMIWPTKRKQLLFLYPIPVRRDHEGTRHTGLREILTHGI